MVSREEVGFRVQHFAGRVRGGDYDPVVSLNRVGRQNKRHTGEPDRNISILRGVARGKVNI